MQFMITAYDGTDPKAAERREKARPAHLEGASKLRDRGHLIAGGAILGDNEKMIGSTMYVEFDSREELDAWLLNDPYVTEGVWEDISIQRIRLAIKL
ncbi:MAG: YciI family protein [Pseudohongiellaceae bacterium]|jgi:uncharacterized protein YciI